MWLFYYYYYYYYLAKIANKDKKELENSMEKKFTQAVTLVNICVSNKILLA